MLEALRFVRPVTPENLKLVDDLLATLHRKATTTIHLEFLEEKGNKLFKEYLIKNKALINLRMKEQYYYLVAKPDDGMRSCTNLSASMDTLTDIREGSEDNFSIPYWVVITIKGNELTCRAHIPEFHADGDCNSKQIIQMVRHKVEELVQFVNCTLLVDQLRSTLECSDLLQIGDVPVEKSERETRMESAHSSMIGRTASNRGGPKKTVKTKFEKFALKTDRFANVKPEEEEQEQRGLQIITSEPKHESKYKVPLVHTEYFPISDKFKTDPAKKKDGIALLKDSSMLRYFRISNRPNCYLASHESQVYILYFEEIEASTLEKERSYIALDSPGITLSRIQSETTKSTSRESGAGPTLALPKEQDSRSKEKKLSLRGKESSSEIPISDAKTIITLKIHSLEERDEKAIQQVIRQISEQLTAESIKILVPKFLKYMNKHIKLAKEDYDFFATGVPIKVLCGFGRISSNLGFEFCRSGGTIFRAL